MNMGMPTQNNVVPSVLSFWEEGDAPVMRRPMRDRINPREIAKEERYSMVQFPDLSTL
jgi:hypothetical protein